MSKNVIIIFKKRLLHNYVCIILYINVIVIHESPTTWNPTILFNSSFEVKKNMKYLSKLHDI